MTLLLDPTEPLRAITAQQPYPFLIERGIKTVETRGRRCNYRGLVGIHAGKRWAPGWLDWVGPDEDSPAADRFHMLADLGVITDEDVNGSGSYRIWRGALPLGAIVAVANLVDCVPIHEWLCQCDHTDGIYALIAPKSIGKGDLVGLFEHPGGRGVDHERWPPSRLDCLDPRHPRQQAPYGDFRCGRWALLLEDVRRLPEPVPCRGAQAVPWRVPDNVAARVREQLAASSATATPEGQSDG